MKRLIDALLFLAGIAAFTIAFLALMSAIK